MYTNIGCGFLYRIVIADDETLIRYDIKEMLEVNGYCVVGDASDGFDAIELCKKHHPDMAILDIKMPLLDGLKAAEIIMKDKLAKSVLILTAYSDKKMIEEAKKSKVISYLVKPIDECSLIPAIEIAISKQNEIEKINKECEKAKKALESRKLVDRAKGILMDKKGMSEMAAYEYLRKVAMSKECTIAQIAETVILSNQ